MKQSDDHMGARFWFNPSRFRWHGHRLIGQLKQSFYFRLFEEENYFMFENLFVFNDSRNIFQFLEIFFIKKFFKYLILEPKTCNLLQDVSRKFLKGNSIDLIIKFKDNFIVVEFFINIESLEILEGYLFDINVVEFHQLIDDLNIFRYILKDSMLRVNHNILA